MRESNALVLHSSIWQAIRPAVLLSIFSQVAGPTDTYTFGRKQVALWSKMELARYDITHSPTGRGSAHCHDVWPCSAYPTFRRSCANGLRPSHSCIVRASVFSPLSSILPASISDFSVVTPIHTDVMLRSELRTCRSTS